MINIFDPGNLIDLIKAIGYFGLFAIIFAESGLFIGFFLPGDSLLFTAGFLASQGLLSYWPTFLLAFSAAVLGDNVGYAFGKKVGPKIFTREDSLFFHKHNLIKAEKFYEAHGAKTIVLARFLPIVRTFAPIVAGVGNMDYRKFLIYNLGGGFFWSFTMVTGGYYLGKLIPDVDKYLVPIILGIIATSFLPSIVHLVTDRKEKHKGNNA